MKDHRDECDGHLNETSVCVKDRVNRRKISKVATYYLLTGSVSSNHSLRSLEKNLKIKPWRTEARITQVHANHVVEPYTATALDLPDTSDPRFCLKQAATMPGRVSFHLVRN